MSPSGLFVSPRALFPLGGLIRARWTGNRRVRTCAMMNTRGQLEADVSYAIVKFEKEHMGRVPDETKSCILDDMILIRSKQQ